MTSTLTGKTAIITEHPPVSARPRPAFWQKGMQRRPRRPARRPPRKLGLELGDEQTLATPTDVTDPSACAALVDRTLDHFGSLDVLVNNAGLGLYAPIIEADPEDWRTMFDVKASGIPDSCKPGTYQQAEEVMETCSE